MQEQFALQLINQFYQIFVLEKTHLKLTTYEVLSLGKSIDIICFYIEFIFTEEIINYFEFLQFFFIFMNLFFIFLIFSIFYVF